MWLVLRKYTTMAKHRAYTPAELHKKDNYGAESSRQPAAPHA